MIRLRVKTPHIHRLVPNPRLVPDFVIPALNDERFGEFLSWVDRDQGLFKIKYKHGNTRNWSEDSVEVFKGWDQVKGRNPCSTKASFTKSRQRFKNAADKCPDLEKIPCSPSKNEEIYKIRFGSARHRNCGPEVQHYSQTNVQQIDPPQRLEMGSPHLRNDFHSTSPNFQICSVNVDITTGSSNDNVCFGEADYVQHLARALPDETSSFYPPTFRCDSEKRTLECDNYFQANCEHNGDTFGVNNACSNVNNSQEYSLESCFLSETFLSELALYT